MHICKILLANSQQFGNPTCPKQLIYKPNISLCEFRTTEPKEPEKCCQQRVICLMVNECLILRKRQVSVARAPADREISAA